MKKTLIISLAVVLALVAATGYAAEAKAKEKAKDKPSAEQGAIQKVLDDWKAAAIAVSMDKLMVLYSEKFSSFEYGDKAGLKKFLQDAMDSGYLKDASVDLAKAKITVNKEKGTATATPIELKASFGTASIDLSLSKEKDAWLITGMEVQQY